MAKKQISVSLRKPPPPADLEKLVVESVVAPKSTKRPKATDSDVRELASTPPTNDVVAPGSPGSVEEFVAKAQSHRGDPGPRSGFCTITIDLPENVADRLAQFCAQSGRDVHEVVAEILAKHFAEQLGTVVEPAQPAMPARAEATTMDAIVAWVRERIRFAGAVRARWMRLGQMAWASL